MSVLPSVAGGRGAAGDAKCTCQTVMVLTNRDEQNKERKHFGGENDVQINIRFHSSLLICHPVHLRYIINILMQKPKNAKSLICSALNSHHF